MNECNLTPKPSQSRTGGTERMSIAEYRQIKAAKVNKYGAKRTFADGRWFDSKGEANRWMELRLLEMSGNVKNLQRQKVLHLSAHVTWKIDFLYEENGTWVYEDFKGRPTRDYIVKRDLLRDLIEDGKMCVIYRESNKGGIAREYRPPCDGCEKKCKAE